MFFQISVIIKLYVEFCDLVTTPIRYSESSVYLESVKLIIVSGKLSYCEVLHEAVRKLHISRTVIVLK